jgi:hypothetical protein
MRASRPWLCHLAPNAHNSEIIMTWSLARAMPATGNRGALHIIALWNSSMGGPVLHQRYKDISFLFLAKATLPNFFHRSKLRPWQRKEGQRLDLHLGCGPKYVTGFVNIDANPFHKIDLWLARRVEWFAISIEQCGFDLFHSHARTLLSRRITAHSSRMFSCCESRSGSTISCSQPAKRHRCL